MPRGPRLDYPGALHRLIVRGIERGAIFRTDHDRQVFLERLAALVLDSQAGLYAGALMPNHAHALLRTGTMPLSRLTLRWLGPYATAFNRRHRRVGYLFQNRFKSVLVEQDPYFLELVRDIHLNPVRSRLPVSIDALDQYPWTGHSVLLGHRPFPAQAADSVLNRFGATVGSARRAYREFVQQGPMSRRAPDLEGGGLRRSTGTWQLMTTTHLLERCVAPHRHPRGRSVALLLGVRVPSAVRARSARSAVSKLLFDEVSELFRRLGEPTECLLKRGMQHRLPFSTRRRLCAREHRGSRRSSRACSFS
jgi:REP element-mobilizing transposase RayT